MSKFETLKPSHPEDISLLVYKKYKEAVKQPYLAQKMFILKILIPPVFILT